MLLHNGLSDDSLEPLAHLNKLAILGLAYNNIQHPTCLFSMPDLDRVNFGHTAFDDEGLQMVTSTAHLYANYGYPILRFRTMVSSASIVFTSFRFFG